MARFPFTVAFAYTRDETNHHADVLLPGGDRPREPAADPHRRLQVRRAVLGPPGLRAAAAGGRDARRGARLHRRSRPSSRRAPGCSTSTTRRSTRGAAGVPLKGAALGLLARARAARTRRGDLGRRVPRGERRAHRRQGGARARLVEGARPRDAAVPAHRLVPVPDAGAQGAALRAALPGAAVARRHRARPAAARARHALVGQAARPSTRRCRCGRTSPRRGTRRW